MGFFKKEQIPIFCKDCKYYKFILRGSDLCDSRNNEKISISYYRSHTLTNKTPYQINKGNNCNGLERK